MATRIREKPRQLSTCIGEIRRGRVFKYVALGDSFSAGEGVDPYLRDGYNEAGAQTGRVDNRCHRSTRAYAESVVDPRISNTQSLYALASGGGDPGTGKRIDKYGSDLNVRAAAGVEWGFFACSGAATTNVLPAAARGIREDWSGGYRDLVPQLDNEVVNRETDLVTISIGGNDVHFSDVIAHSALTRCNTPAYVAYLNQSIDSLKPQLVNVYRAVKAKAPLAKAFVLGYPQLFPRTSAEQSCTKLSFWLGEEDMLRKEEARLNDVIRSAAKTAGVRFISMESAFRGHEICGNLGEWINGPSATYKVLARTHSLRLPKDDESFHPNVSGQQVGYAATINARLAR